MLAKHIKRFSAGWLLGIACLCAGTCYWLLGGSVDSGSAGGNPDQATALTAHSGAATQKVLPTASATHSDFHSGSADGWYSHAGTLTAATGHGTAASHVANSPSSSAAAHYAHSDEAPVLLVHDNGAVEVAIPVSRSGGTERYAGVPVALALAADPRGLPQPMRAAVQSMANDFLADIAPEAAGNNPTSAAYFSRWQAAARKSDQEFKMRYGKVAFVQMNLLTAQEAAASAR